MKKTKRTTGSTTTLKRNVFERIQAFNHGRQAELLRLKFAKMKDDVFRFYRGTCHLFYEDWSLASTTSAPPVWICGDLHTENFGSYKGSNRLVYFDINDFDEGVLAPATFEITRLVTSIFIAAQTYSFTESEARSLAHTYLSAYRAVLASGKAGAMERETAVGCVGDLLHAVQQRSRRTFLNERTTLSKAQTRSIVTDGGKRYRPISENVAQRVTQCIENFGAGLGKEDFFKVIDVKQRIAGTGSLGVKRFAVLIEGNGSPHKNYLLDLKEATPSSVEPFVGKYSSVLQPVWSNEAVRVVEIQHRMQFSTPALLSTIELGGKHYILRELQPAQDKLNLASLQGKYKRFATAIRSMAELTAFAQLRSSGRQGSASADELIEFASQSAWEQDIVHYAEVYTKQVHRDYEEFCTALGNNT
jgi:uncharacterized protein (DUF2252 family)